MVRVLLAALLLGPLVAAGQTGGIMPIFLGRPVLIVPPGVDGSGRTVVFGSSITPQGAVLQTTDLYTAATDGSGLRRLTHLSDGLQTPQGVHEVALSADGSRAAYAALLPSAIKGGEQVHVVDVASGADRIVAIDTEGCIQPLTPTLCVNCFFTCVNTPHLSGDAGKVLYSVRRSEPFYLVNADGTGLTRLPVYSGALAPGPQRVISRSGQVVFTSSAPFGPTFAAAAQDVYLMNLDGSGIRAVTKFGADAALYAINATISADGGTIAFESNRDPETGKAGTVQHIWVVKADGSGLRPLTSNVTCLSLDCPQPGGSSPSISGDGSRVVFVNGSQIFLARSDGSGGKALTNFRMSAARDPVISDDGTRVVFTLGPRDGGRGAIYSMNSDGSNLQAVFAPRGLNQNGVVAAAYGAAPSPGSLFTAFAFNLVGDQLSVATKFPLPTELDGVSVLVNGVKAPVLAVTPWQVNAQLPTETAEGPAAFQPGFADGTLGVAIAAAVQAIAPAIFQLSATETQAAVLHVGSGIPADKDHPAHPGETLEIYATGLGPTSPPVAAGQPAPSSPLAQTLVFPEVLFGDRPAEVRFSGLTPGLAGVYQVNAVVPSDMKPGQYVVRLRVGEIITSAFGAITVQ